MLSLSPARWYHWRTMQPSDERPGHTGADTTAKGSAQTSSGPVPGAGGITFDSAGRVLLLQQMNGNWVFPKGHIEPGENPLQAAIREVKEETGVQAACPQSHRTWHTSYRNSRGVPRRIIWFALLADGNATMAPEPGFAQVQFADPQAALKQLAFVQDRQLLQEVLAEVAAPGSMFSQGLAQS